jgi:MFS transporter, FLVCR family, feline leukemia virus subgroup C receptor-related protein
LGCLCSPLIISDSSSFGYYMLGVAVVCIVCLLGIFIFFVEKPEYSPSAAAEFKRNLSDYESSSGFFIFKILNQAYILCKENSVFFLLSLTFGLAISSANAAWATFIEVLLYATHPNSVQIGLCGFIGLISAMIGSITWPIIAYRTGQYRLSIITIFGSSAVLLPLFCLFARSSQFSFIEIDIVTVFLNFNIGGAYSIVFEYAAELTFPVSESLSSGIVMGTAQLFSVILIEVLTWTNASADDISISICTISFIAFILSYFIRNELNRSKFEEAEESSKSFIDWQ